MMTTAAGDRQSGECEHADEESLTREARQAFLLELSDALRPLADPVGIEGEACRLLGEQLGADRVYYVKYDAENGCGTVARGYVADGSASLIGRYDYAAYRSVYERVGDGRTWIVADVTAARELAPDERELLAAQRVAAWVDVPLVKQGKLVAVLCVVQDAARQWSGAEATLVEETAERTWAAVERACAEAALRTSQAWLAAQKEALQAAVNDAPLETSLGVLIRTACEQDRDLRCAFYLANSRGTELHHVVGMNEDYARVVEGFKIGADSLSCGLATHLAQPVITADVAEEPLWKPWLRIAQAHDFRACWSFPIQTAAGKAVGTFAMYYRQPRKAQACDHEFAAIVTRAAAIIISRHRAAEERMRVEKALRDSEARLWQASRAKDEFLAMLGHELRNPLQPIMTTLQLMQLRQPDVLAGERTIIESQVRHMIGLVDDLLDVSRIARGRVELHKAPLDVGDIVIRAIETARPLLEQREQTVERAVGEGLVVEGDRRRLVQVVTNLLTNAAKYSPPGHTIYVSAGAEADEAVIRVRDRGIGIDPELLPHIFDSFTQDAQSAARSLGGLGLGLAIVHNLVELHGGRVSASSAGRDCGSEFVVRLALLEQRADAEVPAGHRAAARPEAGAPEREKKLKVLIVDDYESTADTLAQLLQAQGFATRVAYDGAAALTAAAEFAPAVALVDIGLPVMDGYQVARELRAAPELADMRLIAVTGYGQESDRRRVKEAGFDEHLVKPIDSARVGNLIERIAGESRASATPTMQ